MPPRSLCAAKPHPASRDQPPAVLRPSAWRSLPPAGAFSALRAAGRALTWAVDLLAGLLLPWVAGIAALVLLRGRRALSAPGEIAWIAGAGYLVGAFALTLWMRVLSFAGVAFGALAIAAPLAGGIAVGRWHIGGAALASAWREALRAARCARRIARPDSAASNALAWRALLAWIALRFLLLGARSLRGSRSIPGMRGPSGRPRRASGSNSAASSRSSTSTPGSPPTAPRISTRRRANPADGAAAAGVGVHRARPLGRRADELAVVADRRGAGARRLRCDCARSSCPPLAALVGGLSRHLAAARERPRRAGRLRGPAARRLLHRARARAPCAGPRHAICAMPRSRGAGVRCTQIGGRRARLGSDARSRRDRRALARRGVKIAACVTRHAILVRARRARAVESDLLGHPLHLDFDPALAVARRELLPARLLESAVVRRVSAVALLAWRELASPRARTADARRRRRGDAALRRRRVSQRRAQPVAEQTTVNRATLQFAPLPSSSWRSRSAPSRGA